MKNLFYGFVGGALGALLINLMPALISFLEKGVQEKTGFVSGIIVSIVVQQIVGLLYFENERKKAIDKGRRQS